MPAFGSGKRLETVREKKTKEQVTKEAEKMASTWNTLKRMLGVALPLYPLLIAIYQRMGRYDEVVEEFKRLRDEHETIKGAYHGT